MKARLLLNFVTALAGIAAIVVVSCSEDSSPTGGGGGGGGTDTTPPGVDSVYAVDGNHIAVVFDEDVKKETAEVRENYVIVEQATPLPHGALGAPNDTIGVQSVALGEDKRTASITLQTGLNIAPYNCTVRGVEDLSGNRITADVIESFTGNNNPDVTNPEIIFRFPAPGATGVGTGESVIVQFSEAMDGFSVMSAFTWTGPGGDVAYQVDEEDDNRYVFVPQQLLMNNTTYNVGVSSTAQDWAGNPVATTNWSFTTTANVDNTRPFLVGSSPANGAKNVAVSTNISLTFSEPVNQYNEIEIFVIPQINDGVLTWDLGGARLNFDPAMDLMDNTQYKLIIPEGAVTDLAGNGLDKTYEIVFSTGPSFFTGSIEGTLSGDPQSTYASNPEGAIVVAAIGNPFEDNNNNGPNIVGSAVANGVGHYDINYLANGWYYLISILDSNNDGFISPEDGDAIGVYNLNFAQQTGAIDSVQVVGGGTVTGVNFQLFDPVSISGVVNYAGSAYTGGNYQVYVEAFDVPTFNPSSPVPTYEVQRYYPGDLQYRFGEFDDDLSPGSYYLGAYMDVNFNQTYDDGIDPIGWYVDGGSNLIAVNVVNGFDAMNRDFAILDPVVAQRGSASWGSAPAQKPTPYATLLRNVRRMLEEIEK